MSNEEEDISQYIAELNADSKESRRKAAVCLGKSNNFEATKHLIDILIDSDESLKKTIIKALKELRDPSAIDPLVELFQKESSLKVKAVVAWVLGSFIYDDFDMDSLIANLKVDNNYLKKNIIFALGNKRYKKAVPELIKLLKSKESLEIRKLVIWALGQTQDERALLPLIESLNDPSYKIRKKSASVLVEFPYTKQKINDLLEILNNNNHPGRINVIHILGKMSYNKCVPKLIEIAKNEDEHYLVRKKTIKVLGAMKDARALDVLTICIKDPSQSIRTVAIEALMHDENINDETLNLILNALNDEYSQVRKVALNYIHYIIGTSYIPIEITNIVPKLIELLNNDIDENIRASIPSLLRILNDKRTIEPLKKALGDSSGKVRANAIQILNLLGEKLNLDPFINDLNNPSDEVRDAAFSALHNSRELITYKEKLLDALKDENHLGHKQIIYLLRELRLENIAPFLIKIAKNDKDLGTRIEAMFHLYAYTTSEIKELLLEAINDPNKKIRNASIYLLKNKYPSIKIEGPDMPSDISDLLFVDKKKKKKVDIPETDKKNISKLIDLLKNERNALLRWKVAVELAKYTNDNRIIRPLISALNDRFTKVRIAAVYALGKIKNNQIWKHLIPILKDPSIKVRQLTIKALTNSQGINSLEELLDEEMKYKVPIERTSQIAILSKKKFEKGIPLLINLIKNNDDIKIKHAAIYALYYQKDERVLDILVEALNDPAKDVRSAPLSALLYGPHDIQSKKDYLIQKYQDKTSFGRYETFYLIGGERKEKSLCSSEFLVEALYDDHFFIKRTARVLLDFHQEGHLVPKDYDKIKRVSY